MYRIDLPLDRIKRLYEKGWTIKRLADKFYVSYWAMYCRLNEMGIIRHKTRKYLSPIELKFQTNEVGMTFQEIADINGVSKRTVSRRMKTVQFKKEKRRNYKVNRSTILGVHYMRFDKGMKLKDIAKIYSLSRRTICSIVKMDVQPHIDALKEKGEEVGWNS